MHVLHELDCLCSGKQSLEEGGRYSRWPLQPGFTVSLVCNCHSSPLLKTNLSRFNKGHFWTTAKALDTPPPPPPPRKLSLYQTPLHLLFRDRPVSVPAKQWKTLVCVKHNLTAQQCEVFLRRGGGGGGGFEPQLCLGMCTGEFKHKQGKSQLILIGQSIAKERGYENV